MRFYKVVKRFNFNNRQIKSLQKGDILCDSLRLGWVLVATPTFPTKHFNQYNLDSIFKEYIRYGYLQPLTKKELLVVQDHIKKEMVMDLVFSLREYVDMDEIRGLLKF